MKTRMKGRHPALEIVWLCVSSLLVGCFEDPVRETVEIELLPEDRVKITARTELRQVSMEENEVAWRRIDLARRQILEQTDPWTRRFAMLEPQAETYRWEKFDGALSSVERTALTEAGQLSNFRCS